ncbi:hypothetical protein VQ056_29520 [Paenibacillus sp. JTLBN-2024]
MLQESEYYIHSLASDAPLSQAQVAKKYGISASIRIKSRFKDIEKAVIWLVKRQEAYGII